MCALFRRPKLVANLRFYYLHISHPIRAYVVRFSLAMSISDSMVSTRCTREVAASFISFLHFFFSRGIHKSLRSLLDLLTMRRTSSSELNLAAFAFFCLKPFDRHQAADVPPDSNVTLSKVQAENAALRLALYETVKQDMALKVMLLHFRLRL